jgi:hypothetical protein
MRILSATDHAATARAGDDPGPTRTRSTPPTVRSRTSCRVPPRRCVSHRMKHRHRACLRPEQPRAIFGRALSVDAAQRQRGSRRRPDLSRQPRSGSGNLVSSRTRALTRKGESMECRHHSLLSEAYMITSRACRWQPHGGGETRCCNMTTSTARSSMVSSWPAAGITRIRARRQHQSCPRAQQGHRR